MILSPEDLLEAFWRDNRQPAPLPPKIEPANGQNVLVRSGLPFLTLRLPFEVPHAEMLEEALRLKAMFVPHRANGHHRGWKSLVLHGLSSVHTEGHERYGFTTADEAPYGWTDVSRFCPVTTSFFRDTFGYVRFERVRFMLLEAGGFVLPHVDTPHNRLSATNMALNNPSGCEFVMREKGLVPFAPGTINMLALANEHAVWNRSTEDRIHMIVHGLRDMNGHWNETILRSYEATYP